MIQTRVATKPAECSGIIQLEVKSAKFGESAANCRIKLTRADISLDFCCTLMWKKSIANVDYELLFLSL